MSVDSYFFETALICENGDLITPCLESNPLLYSDFCEICSAKTISKCPSCGATIRGLYGEKYYVNHSSMSAPKLSICYRNKTTYKVPAYCCKCGKPYPWTVSRVNEFNAVVDATPNLNEEEKVDLKSSFPSVLSDSPGTISASLSIRDKLGKLSSSAAGPLKEILTKVATAAALKILGL